MFVPDLCVTEIKFCNKPDSGLMNMVVQTDAIPVHIEKALTESQEQYIFARRMIYSFGPVFLQWNIYAIIGKMEIWMH